MAIAFRASASGSGGNTVNVTIPGSVIAGDCMLLVVDVNTDCALTTPSGWTVAKAQQSSEAGGVNGAVYRRTAAPTDASTVVTITNDAAAGVKSQAGMCAYPGVDPTSPIPLTIPSALYTGGSASISSPALPSVPVGSFVIEAALTKSSSSTTFTAIPSGSTQRISLIGTGGGHTDLCIVDRGPVAAGTFGGNTFTEDATMSSGISYTIALAELSQTQTLRPSTDITVGDYTAVPTPGVGVAHAARIGETFRDDTTYVSSPTGPTAEVYETRLTAGLDPHASGDHTINIVIGTAGGAVSSTCVVALVEGTTVIADASYTDVPDTPTLETFTITGGEADSIVDYANLRLRFTWTAA